MSTKTLLKHARLLQQKKYRDLHGQYLVQGPKLVQELLRSDHRVEALLATATAIERLQLQHATVVPDHEMDRIGTLESGNEVIAIVHKPEVTPVAGMGPSEWVIALDGISDPGNLGTVVRIAAWFGVQRVWCSANSVEVFNPKCVQASMGAIFRVRVDHLDLPAELRRQQAAGATLYMASMEGRNVLQEKLVKKAVLILGNESHGLSDAVRGLGGVLIGIPGGGAAESLNVAMAASALCMEFTRQRAL